MRQILRLPHFHVDDEQDNDTSRVIITLRCKRGRPVPSYFSDFHLECIKKSVRTQKKTAIVSTEPTPPELNILGAMSGMPVGRR